MYDVRKDIIYGYEDWHKQSRGSCISIYVARIEYGIEDAHIL